MKVSFIASGLLGLTPLLAGCGGTVANGAAPARAGHAVVQITWPTRTDKVIPTASNSIVITLGSGSNAVSSGPIGRPTSGTSSSWSSPALDPGTYPLTAQAFPNPDGTGTLQAKGTGSVTIKSSSNTQAGVTMASTVAALSVYPTSTTVAVGSITSLNVSATDANGNIVLVGSSTISWTSSSNSITTVSPNGFLAYARGQNLGQTTVVAKFTEVEPKLGQGPVYAPAIPTTVVAPGLGANWCKDRCDAFNSGQSAVAGTKAYGDEFTDFWGTSTTAALAPVSSPNGTEVYVGAPDSSFAFTHASLTNSSPWTAPVPVNGHAAVGTDGTIYVAGVSLWALRPSDGAIIWSVSLPSANSGPPAIGPDGTIYLMNGTTGGSAQLIATHPDGTPAWSTPISDGGNLTTPAIGSDGTIYIGNAGLFALSKSGSILWSVPSSAKFSSPAISKLGVIYAEGSDDFLYGYNSSGALAWSPVNLMSGANLIRQVAPALDSNGYVCCVVNTSPSGGTASYLEVFSVKGSVPSPVFTTNDGLLASVALSSDGYIYAHTGHGLDIFEPGDYAKVWTDGYSGVDTMSQPPALVNWAGGVIFEWYPSHQTANYPQMFGYYADTGG